MFTQVVVQIATRHKLEDEVVMATTLNEMFQFDHVLMTHSLQDGVFVVYVLYHSLFVSVERFGGSLNVDNLDGHLL